MTIALIIIRATFPVIKADKVVDIWLNEMFKDAPFEPFESVVVCDADVIREGDIAEVLNIIHVVEKMASKARRLTKKRWKVFEKVEGFSYSVDIYITPEIYDPPTKQRYNNWKEASQFIFANLEDIF